MMIDIHSHILPGVDDGSQSVEESLEMARVAVAEGIRSIIATPHHANGKYINEANSVKTAVDELNALLQSQRIPLTVGAGQEIRLYADLIDDFHENKLLSLNGSRYILIEFPSNRIPRDTENLFHELRIMGLIPIIAHPERNMEIAEDSDKLYDLIQLGALAQVTSHSINGAFGPKIQQLSLSLCRRRLIHFVSSDAHNLSHRGFGLGEAYDRLRRELGSDYVEYAIHSAEALSDNIYIEVETPRKTEKKWYEFWK